MHWDIDTLVPIFATITYAVVFLVVVFSKPQTQARLAFRWYLLAMLIWSLSAFLVFVDFGEVVFWFRMMIFAAIGSMVAIFYFVQTILPRKRKWASWVFWYGAISMLAGLLTNLVIKSAAFQGGVLSYEFSPFTVLIAGPGYGLTVFSFVELYRGYQVSADSRQRNRLRYLMIGLGLIIIASIVNFTPLGIYPIDIAANGVTAVLIAYAILRHNLLDIRVVIRKGLLYSIPTMIIGTAYFLIISLSLNIFHSYSGIEIFFLSFLVAMLTAVVAEPLRVQAQSWVDRLFFREKYDSTLMLQRLSGSAASVLDLLEITSMILEEVTSTLHIQKAAFFLKREDTGEFSLTAHKGLSVVSNLRLGENHPVVLWFSGNGHALMRKDIEVLPQFKSLWGWERRDLDRIEAELFIPLKAKNKLVGIFAVGPKRSEQPYSRDDQLTLTTLANQTAVAIENARLYTSEQFRREELDTLYSMARNLVATDNIENVLNIIARHAMESTHVTFARILTLEDDGTFTCRVVCPIRDLGQSLCVGRTEPSTIQHFYEQALSQGEAVILTRSDPIFSEVELQELFMHEAKTLCLSPLRVVDEPMGLIVLGESRSSIREPFDDNKKRLITVISDHAANTIRRTNLHDQLEENFIQTIFALANALDARDSYISDHSNRIAALVDAMCKALEFGEKQTQAVLWAAKLHDIGKIGVPDSILRKPGPLTDEEWVVMKNHPVVGAEIVAPLTKLSHAAPIIRSHHERFDGSGYPDGLVAEEIPLEARILTVVDAYVAIIDERVYRKARSHDEAIAEIKKNSGTQFDPDIVELFCNIANAKNLSE
ncbi:MAG: HD domain-containing protein [Chloroflexi bacterium]|nr:HD domain-containing protein [Chloroflexota bacterium]